ncbi:hypothetical protein KCU61_g493, partial [Aureobasidium melanogenum]
MASLSQPVNSLHALFLGAGIAVNKSRLLRRREMSESYGRWAGKCKANTSMGSCNSGKAACCVGFLRGSDRGFDWIMASSSEGNHIAAVLALYQSYSLLQCPFVLFADALLDCPLMVLGQDFTSVYKDGALWAQVVFKLSSNICTVPPSAGQPYLLYTSHLSHLLPDLDASNTKRVTVACSSSSDPLSMASNKCSHSLVNWSHVSTQMLSALPCLLTVVRYLTATALLPLQFSIAQP